MKRILLIVMMAASSTWQMVAAERTIIKPESLYQNLLARLYINSVSLSDSATMFSMQVSKNEMTFFLSSETCLRDAKGRRYTLRRIVSDDGLLPDVPRTFEDIGKNRFDVQLVFPPLPADVKEVDMVDPHYFNHGIFGIRLDGTPLPPFELPKYVDEQLKVIMAEKDTLPEVDYRFGWATIKGQLLEYRPGMCEQITLVSGLPNSLPREHCDSLCTQVSPTGSFTFRLPVAHITPVSLTFEPSQQTVRGIVYVGPDAETEVYFNMREINQRLFFRPKNKSILYVTNGPLAQLANELNEHLIYYLLDFDFTHNLTHEEWNHYKETQAMLPTEQLKILEADLDTMKVKEQWSPAMKELVKLYWKMKKAQQLNIFPSRELEKEAQMSHEAQERLVAWQRDAVVAELDTYERLINDPKMLYCPDLSYFLFNIHYSTLFPDHIAHENTLYKWRRQLDGFHWPDADAMEGSVANLPTAYRQLALAWQDIYRREHDLLAVKEMAGDTLTGIADSLIFRTLCERYRGRTVFIHFWRNYDHRLAKHVVLPLQRELADRDIVWVNVFDTQQGNWDVANKLRYFTKLRGEHFFFKLSGNDHHIRIINASMGIEDSGAEPYAIIAPDGSIVRNGGSASSPLLWMELQDYLGIRHCLQGLSRVER